MERGIVLGVHKVTSIHSRRPWQHLIPQDLDVPMPVHGSIHHDQFLPPWWIAPHTMTDGPRFPSLGWTQASISLPPCLRQGGGPPRFRWCGRQVCRLHCKILLMHPWDTPASWLLLAENCHLPTTWQFAAILTVSNIVAWSPLKVQRNINSLYRNPSRLHFKWLPLNGHFPSLESQRSPDNTDYVWPFNLVT